MWLTHRPALLALSNMAALYPCMANHGLTMSLMPHTGMPHPGMPHPGLSHFQIGIWGLSTQGSLKALLEHRGTLRCGPKDTVPLINDLLLVKVEGQTMLVEESCLCIINRGPISIKVPITAQKWGKMTPATCEQTTIERVALHLWLLGLWQLLILSSMVTFCVHFISVSLSVLISTPFWLWCLFLLFCSIWSTYWLVGESTRLLCLN